MKNVVCFVCDVHENAQAKAILLLILEVQPNVIDEDLLHNDDDVDKLRLDILTVLVSQHTEEFDHI